MEILNFNFFHFPINSGFLPNLNSIFIKRYLNLYHIFFPMQRIKSKFHNLFSIRLIFWLMRIRCKSGYDLKGASLKKSKHSVGSDRRGSSLSLRYFRMHSIHPKSVPNAIYNRHSISFQIVRFVHIAKCMVHGLSVTSCQDQIDKVLH